MREDPKTASTMFPNIRASVIGLWAVATVLGCSSGKGPVSADAAAKDSAVQAVAPAAALADAGPPPKLYVKRFAVNIRVTPSEDAVRLGYLRVGSVLQAKASAPVGAAPGCRRGFWELTTGGFVCDGRDVTPFATKRPPERPPAQPNLTKLLPYDYGYNRRDNTPMYRRLPTDEEAAMYEGYKIPGLELPDGGVPSEAPAESGLLVAPSVAEPAAVAPVAPVAVEPSVAPALPAANSLAQAEPLGVDPVPLDAGPPTLDSLMGERESVLLRRMVKGFYVSLDRDIRIRDRRYWRTLANGFVPYNRIHKVSTTSFSGVVLDGTEWALPVAFVMSGNARYGRRAAPGERATRGGTLEFHDYIRVASEEGEGKQKVVVTPDGRVFKASDLRMIVARPRPPEVLADEKWVDVDLAMQSLVAYVGDTPVFATLISSGKDESHKDPTLDHRTPPGSYRVLSKHLATTMDGDVAVDGPYSIEDVPYVMYFNAAYALHAAFWHNRFGYPRSHGCINMSPKDAHWIFDWVTPVAHPGWHAAYPTEQLLGTRIYVRGETR